MTLSNVLILLVVFAIVAYLAYWIIMKFFPAPSPIQIPALAIVGLLLLLALLAQFFPGLESTRLWR